MTAIVNNYNTATIFIIQCDHSIITSFLFNDEKFADSKKLDRGSFLICRHEPMNLLGRRDSLVGRFKPVIMMIPDYHDFTNIDYEKIFAFNSLKDAKYFLSLYLKNVKSNIEWKSENKVYHETFDEIAGHKLIYNYNILALNKATWKLTWGNPHILKISDINHLKWIGN